MTRLHSARHGTVDLFSLAGEHRSTLRASLDGFMAFCLVEAFNRAWSAILRSSRCACTTVGAMFGVFAGTRNFAPMHSLVARNAKRYSVIDIKRQVWEFRKRLDVVCVNSPFPSAVLASVLVACVYGLTPHDQRSLVFAAFTMCCGSTLPDWGGFAGFPFKQAFMRAKARAAVCGVELFAASVTSLHEWFSTLAPTFFGAPFGFISVGFSLKCFSARFARFRDALASTFGSMGREARHRAVFLSSDAWMKYVSAVFTYPILDGFDVEIVTFEVLAFRVYERLAAAASACIHGRIVTQHNRSSKYCAVAIQRWADHCGGQPVLLD